MVVELISVGTELLLGNIVNTNTQFLAEKCALLGLTMYHQVTVGDNHDRLAEVIRMALKRSDVIILTGGLGPTEDDLTKEVCAEVMGFPLVEDTHTHERIEEYFRNNIYKVIPDNNWKQAIVPAGCIVLDNDNGTAPGLILEKYGKSAILLPGPPNELYPLFMNQVYPYLQKLQPEVIRSQMVKICGVGESQVEDKILDLIDKQHPRDGKGSDRRRRQETGEAGGKRNQKPFRGLCLLYEGRGDAGAGCGQAVKEIRTDGDDCGVLHRWTAGWPHHQCAGSFRGLQRGLYHIFQ